MERKKILSTEYKSVDSEGIGYNANIDLYQNNKPLPVGEVVKVVNVAEQFNKERQESTNYRLTSTVLPIIYYPQEYYWLGNLMDNGLQSITGITSTSQTSSLRVGNYDLSNILTLNGPNPTNENFNIDDVDDWVGQIIYPYESDYLKLYEIPQFNTSRLYVDEDDSRFVIDTGIDEYIKNRIETHLSSELSMINIGDWFGGSQFVLEDPSSEGETLKIRNQGFKGYSQDGVPFLFSIPVKTEQGWFTALYTPFEHNLEVDDYVFVKPIESNNDGLSTPNYMCDPTMYGFKRVIGSSWDYVGDKSKHYVIIEHKTEYHSDWYNVLLQSSGLVVDYNYGVRSSQGFVKRVNGYSDGGVVKLVSFNPPSSPFTNISGVGIQVTIPGGYSHGLEKGDSILLTLGDYAEGTLFNSWTKPKLYNLSGVYEVTQTVDDFNFIIRSNELEDIGPGGNPIAWFGGSYVFLQPGFEVERVTISKINFHVSEYYLRKGKILTTINEFESSELPMSNGVFGDKNSNVVIEQDINVKGLVDNRGRPLSQLYLSLVKRSGKYPYDFTDVESFFSWLFNYHQVLVKTGDGLEVVSKRCLPNNDINGHIKDVSGGWMGEYGEHLGDWYYIDLVEYNRSTLREERVESLSHRFNTSYRECFGGVCDEIILDVTTFTGWNVYGSNTTTLTKTIQGGDVLLESNVPITTPNEEDMVEGNFIEWTFNISNDYVGDQLYLEFNYKQITSTGVVKILDPNGVVIESARVYPGESSSINGVGQINQYSTVFISTIAGTHTILMGVTNFPTQYTDPTGTIVNTSSGGVFSGVYSNVKIMKFFGIPQYGGWEYNPFGEYQIREYSNFIETADPTTFGIPYYAEFISGLYYWRDLLDIGFFENIGGGHGVDYAFLNGRHYVDITKDLMVSLTPSGSGGASSDNIVIGCTDPLATNYNQWSNRPCGSDVLQGGPCVNDTNGVIQTLISNPMGCCCGYDSTGTGVQITQQNVYATKTTGRYEDGSTYYDYGRVNVGWNRCDGVYPFWNENEYFGAALVNHPIYTNNTKYGLGGVSVGTNNPVFRAAIETGDAVYDVFRFENYQGNIAWFETLYGTLGDGFGGPTFQNNKGQVQQLSDNDSVQNLSTNPGGSWGSEHDGGLTQWSNSETIIDSGGSSHTITPYYFDNAPNVMEFYKFDTSTCKTCYDMGGTSGTGDHFAPRHGWPLIGAGVDTFTNGGGINMTYADLVSYPKSKRQLDGGRPESGAGVVDPWLYDGYSPNIVAHRRESDPNNWRFFYGTCVSTWNCGYDGTSMPTEWGDNSDSGYDTGGTYSSNDYNPTSTQIKTFNGGCNGTTSECERHCDCLMTTGGLPKSNTSLYANDLDNGDYDVYNFDQEQPSYFEPVIPVGETHYYEFRGRVNIEMGVNFDGYEKYHNPINTNRGWSISGDYLGMYTFGPKITYLNPYWGASGNLFNCAGAGCTEDNAILGIKWFANRMSQPGDYMKYTRLYSGFWLGVVSETDKVTYIYDPDNGTSGGVNNASINQSNGTGFNDVKWQHGCGGFDVNGGVSSNRMSYTPCNDHSSGSLSSDCGIATTLSEVFMVGVGITPKDSNPAYDDLVADNKYVPSCGEIGTTSSKSDFQKVWSQSFLSDTIPLKTGDKVFIYTNSIGGAMKTTNSSDNVNTSNEYLPSYWTVRLDQVII